MGRKKLPSRKSLIRKLDKISSEIARGATIRVFGNCPFCRSAPIQGAFHWITRSKHSIRWEIENLIASCYGCNCTMEFNPHPFIQFFLDRWGRYSYDALIRKSNKIAHFSRSDLIEKLENMTANKMSLLNDLVVLLGYTPKSNRIDPGEGGKP